MSRRYWIGVASREHVRVGVRGGFAQFSHGKRGPATRPSQGDWVIYYSGKEEYGEPALCQKFTAIGQILDAEPAQVEQFPGFTPWRRRIDYRRARAVDIRPLIAHLAFIKNKSRWGAAFRFGFLEIEEPDFALIATRMLPNARTVLSWAAPGHAGDRAPDGTPVNDRSPRRRSPGARASPRRYPRSGRRR